MYLVATPLKTLLTLSIHFSLSSCSRSLCMLPFPSFRWTAPWGIAIALSPLMLTLMLPSMFYLL